MKRGNHPNPRRSGDEGRLARAMQRRERDRCGTSCAFLSQLVPCVCVLALTLGGGCVLPIAPEFEDEENLAPFVVVSRPAFGTVVVSDQQTFSVTVEDPNRTDTLYARWLIDYPPFSNDTASDIKDPRPPLGANRINRHVFEFTPDCILHRIATSKTDHPLMLVVSDRPFLDPDSSMVPPEGRLDATAPGAHSVRVGWTFKKDCNATP